MLGGRSGGSIPQLATLIRTKMIYFTADPHFGHANVLKFSNRPFANIEEHDDFLINSINEHVGKQDTLYILGDFAWKEPQKYLPLINCRNRFLIRGNHDPNNIHSYMKNVYDVREIKIPFPEGSKTKVWLSHYPHCYWPSSHYGAFHLYGHHHAMREDTLDAVFPDRKSMDVGIDNAYRLLGAYRPFSAEEIYDILSNKKNHDPVEWYQDNFGPIK